MRFAQLLGVAGRQVVGDLERPETLLAGEDRAEVEAVAALAAGQRGGGAEVDGVGGGRCSTCWTVCTAMEARPFLLIFLATHLATRRNWHLPDREPRDDVRRTGWRVAGASTGRSLCPSG